jgi:hypothetical protein
MCSSSLLLPAEYQPALSFFIEDYTSLACDSRSIAAIFPHAACGHGGRSIDLAVDELRQGKRGFLWRRKFASTNFQNLVSHRCPHA